MEASNMAENVTAEQSLRVEAARLAVSAFKADKIEKRVIALAAYLEKYMLEGTSK